MDNFPRIFFEKYDLISDFDFILKLSKNKIFRCVQKPLSFYRRHKKSMSIQNFEKQVTQMQKWFIDLKKQNFFNQNQLRHIQNHIDKMSIKLEVQQSSFFNFLKILKSNKISISKLKLFIYYLFKCNYFWTRTLNYF